MQLELLPDDILREICSKMSTEQLAKFGQSNKNVLHACSDILTNRKLQYIRKRNRMALPVDGKCDNPNPILGAICDAFQIMHKQKDYGNFR